MRDRIDDFVAQKKLAVVGVSRQGRGFGAMAFKELRGRGYEVYAVNASAKQGQDLFPNLKALPTPVEGVVCIVRPKQTEAVVRECAEAGVRRVWMQQGSESEAAIKFCEENGIAAVHHACILMFAPPVGSFHKLHRWCMALVGRLPS